MTPALVPLPTESSELCVATGGTWENGGCDCSWFNSERGKWSDTLGCTLTRADLAYWCETVSNSYEACTGSENYVEHQCASLSGSDSVAVTKSSYLCKWVGTQDSGYCTIAKPYCD